MSSSQSSAATAWPATSTSATDAPHNHRWQACKIRAAAAPAFKSWTAIVSVPSNALDIGARRFALARQKSGPQALSPRHSRETYLTELLGEYAFGVIPRCCCAGWLLHTWKQR